MNKDQPLSIHHVGVTVRSLERSLRFYREMLDLEPFAVMGISGSEISGSVGVPGAELSLAFIRLGETQLELLEYRSPHGRDYSLRNNDVGAAHVCFQVDDIEAAYEKLRAKGVEFTSPPLRVESGEFAGRAIAYFRDPDGVTLELLEPEP